MKKKVFVFLSLCIYSEVLFGALNFKEKRYKIGSKKVILEIADSNAKRTQGLMHRKKLKKNKGMIFVFNKEDYRSFWMKNTYIPLDIAYFNKNKILLEVYSAAPVISIMQIDIPKYPSKYRAQYVIEMKRGWFKNNKITKGMPFVELD